MNVYPLEHDPYWRQVLRSAEFPFGWFGENFMTEGLLETAVCLGDVFEVGSALVQISQPRQPCWKIAHRWRMKDLALMVQDSGRTGCYFRVIREGTIQAGSRLRLVEHPYPEWTVASASDIMRRREDDIRGPDKLQGSGHLAVGWRKTLHTRVKTKTVEASTAWPSGHNL